MSSVILVTADYRVSNKVDELSKSLGLRLRTVSTVNAATEWLTMQEFDVLLVDPKTTGEDTAVDLLVLGTKHNPTLFAGVLAPNSIVSQEMTVHLLGGRTFHGATAYQALEQALRALPERISFGESNYFAIMVVEDLDAPRDIICAYIESLGFSTVHGTRSAKEAFTRLDSAPYDYFCIITDILMPEESGIELIKRIRSHPILKAVPVIALTSAPSPENLAECLRAGATGFLAKPPKKATLRQELEKAKRIILNKESPRICSIEDVEALERAMQRNL